MKTSPQGLTTVSTAEGKRLAVLTGTRTSPGGNSSIQVAIVLQWMRMSLTLKRLMYVSDALYRTRC